MMFSSYKALVLAVFALMPSSAFASGFQASCSSIALNSPQLSAQCTMENGQQHFTEQDLDFCVGNQRGDLVRQTNGAFSGSCSDCSLTGEGGDVFIVCDCGTGSGSDDATSLDLSSFISNHNGNLACD